MNTKIIRLGEKKSFIEEPCGVWPERVIRGKTV
jgi:hypothetical protein